MKQKPKELDWEKEFDWTMMNDETHSFDEQWHYLGNFISKILQEQREEIIEGFEKLTDNFPKLIKDTRKTLMENQTKFGARFGLAHNTISYIEQGKFESPWSIISFCQKYQLKSLKKKK